MAAILSYVYNTSGSSRSEIKGYIDFMKQFLSLPSHPKEKRAQTRLIQLLCDCDDDSYFTNLLVKEFIGVIELMMDRVGNGEFCSSWSLRDLTMDIHDRIKIKIQEEDMEVSSKYIPSGYVYILDWMIKDVVLGTKYDLDLFEGNNSSTATVSGQVNE
jgi:hypothetical protein